MVFAITLPEEIGYFKYCHEETYSFSPTAPKSVDNCYMHVHISYLPLQEAEPGGWIVP